MSITFLEAVTSVLVRVSEVSQDVGTISTFSDSARSTKIAMCIQCWNDVILEIADVSGVQLPKSVATTTITMVDATSDDSLRYYTLPSNFEQIIWPITNSADGYIISEYPGGWTKMRVDRAQPQLFVGIPEYAVVEPVTRKLLFDTTPDSSVAGSEWTLAYIKTLGMTNETDVFPFSDDAVRALYGAVAEAYKYERQRIFDVRKYNKHKALAISIITPNAQDGRW